MLVNFFRSRLLYILLIQVFLLSFCSVFAEVNVPSDFQVISDCNGGISPTKTKITIDAQGKISYYTEPLGRPEHGELKTAKIDDAELAKLYQVVRDSNFMNISNYSQDAKKGCMDCVRCNLRIISNNQEKTFSASYPFLISMISNKIYELEGKYIK